eukprot:6198569-Pleurochrysis_carterae.AAC.2
MQTPNDAQMPGANGVTARDETNQANARVVVTGARTASSIIYCTLCYEDVLLFDLTLALYPACVAGHHITQVLLDQKGIKDYGFQVSRDLYKDISTYDEMPEMLTGYFDLWVKKGESEGACELAF